MALFGEGSWTGTQVVELRRSLRMSQELFAKRLGCAERTILRWEQKGADARISPVYQAALDTLLATSPPVTSDLPTPGDEMQRRDLLKSAATAGLVAALPAADAGAELAERALGRPDVRTADLLMQVLHSAMAIDDTHGSDSATGIVAAARATSARLTRVGSPEALRCKLFGVHAETVAFAGTLAFDQGDHATALALYRDARDLAHEAEDADIGAYVLCHLSQLAVWDGNARRGADHAAAAVAWAAESKDRPLRAYTHLRAAQALAHAGQRDACLRELDMCSADLPSEALLRPDESRAYFLGPGMFASYRGECLALIGDPTEAAKAADEARGQFAEEMVRDRALAELNRNKGLRRGGEIDGAAEAVAEAANLAGVNTSRRLADAILTERRAMGPWAATAPVRELDQVLHESGIVGV
jgi:transcriptional regulator with XRE-family HTH domain